MKAKVASVEILEGVHHLLLLGNGGMYQASEKEVGSDSHEMHTLREGS